MSDSRQSGRSVIEHKHPSEAAVTPSSALLTAALAGLMCVGSGCRGDSDNAAATGPQVISTTEASDMTFAQFSEDCETRGGLVETHAACGGASSCKGVSFNKHSKKLTEHTCAGGNTCGGMSCVDLPADTGLSGEEVYEASCAGCHASSMEISGMGEADTSTFKVLVPPGTDATQAAADFLNKSVETHVNIVAFGTHGVNSSGSAYANMPAFHKEISRAEIEKVVDHLRGLTPVGEAYEISGQE